MSDNKRIARNTIFLYIRMFIIMGVSIYTSRVVLDKLGVDDFGLYSAVGGVVGMLSFISGTLSIGTSRFITYELGRGNSKRLNITFCTAFYTHLILGLLLILFLETAGLWFVHNKLVIPPDRFNAAIITYHISVFISLVTITQVPYTSMIMAYERMGIYAYLSIFEAVGKLIIVYLLAFSAIDKLVFYTILLAIVQFTTSMLYRIYCRRCFKESKLHLLFEKSTFKAILGFSGWNIMANLANVLKDQGIIILLNLFFQPFVVAAQTLAIQVSNAIGNFYISFRNAIDPQIIKQYAAGDYMASKKLTLESSVYVFDLLLLLGLPFILTTRTIMDIWLVETPAYAVVFTQLAIVQCIISTFGAAFYTPLMAAGKIKSNSLWAVLFGPGVFCILYIVFKLGGDVMWMPYISILSMAASSLLIKPMLLIKEIKGYSWRDFVPCYMTCVKVVSLSLIISYLSLKIIGNSNIVSSIFVFVLSFLSVAFSSYIFLEKTMRKKLNTFILQKIHSIFRN